MFVRKVPSPNLSSPHRHVVPGTQYDACVVPGISWSLGKRVFFIVLSLRYRYRCTDIVWVRCFLSYRFLTIIPKLSVRYPPQPFISSVFSTPFLLFFCPLFWLSSCSFCSNHTIHIRTGVHRPMLQALEMIPIRQFSIWPTSIRRWK